jgi:hypothetical protein
MLSRPKELLPKKERRYTVHGASTTRLEKLLRTSISLWNSPRGQECSETRAVWRKGR